MVPGEAEMELTIASKRSDFGSMRGAVEAGCIIKCSRSAAYS